MPTISQLPPAGSVSSADEVPISQGGTARATSVGALLASAQPAIIVQSLSLLGRTSLGSGGPEQVDLGTGITLSSGTLLADGLDHASFPVASGLNVDADVVISSQGNPMLMQAALLRGLFAAGQNVAIDANGTISAIGGTTITGVAGSGNSISELQVVTTLAEQDLVAVSQGGSNCAVAYGNLLGGITIDQAQVAGLAGDGDMVWVAQGSNVMASQTLGAVWVWIASKLPTYKSLVAEITTNTSLDTTVHNGRILICSQPITLTPLTTNMGNGFQCVVINASSGNILLGTGFVSSSGSMMLSPWQSATLCCVTYSGGTIAFAAMPPGVTVNLAPGQVVNLTNLGATSTTATLSWQAPSTGGIVASYIVQFRLTGTASWSSSPSITSGTSYQITQLEPAASYDIFVEAQNAAGLGVASSILTVQTSITVQLTVPLQITGLTASAVSSSVVQINWSSQSGGSASTSFTIQYRITGSSGWTWSVPGATGTSYSMAGLQASTSYDFSIIGVNSAGSGVASSSVTATTSATSQSAISITWNLLPSGAYTHASGTIGINARVSPMTAPIQFGFSLTASTPPSNWTTAILVNSDLWGAYAPTPLTAGSWYVWAEGLDGSAQTVSTSPFLVS